MSQQDSLDNASLLGVTVKGSKKKKKKRQENPRASIASPFEPVDELSASERAALRINDGRADTAPTPIAKERTHKNSRKPLDPDGTTPFRVPAQHHSEQTSDSAGNTAEAECQQPPTRFGMDPSGLDWKELKTETKQKEQITTKQAQQVHQSKGQPRPKQQQQQSDQKVRQQSPQQEKKKKPMTPTRLNLDRLESKNEDSDEECVAVMDKVKCITPRVVDNTKQGETGNVNIDSVYPPQAQQSQEQTTPLLFRYVTNEITASPNISNNGSVTIHELRSKFESSTSVASSSTRKSFPKRRTGALSEVKAEPKPSYEAEHSIASTGKDSLQKVAVSSKVVRPGFKSENDNTSFGKRDFSIGRFKKPVKKKIQQKQRLPENKLVGNSEFDAPAAWKDFCVGSRSFKERVQHLEPKVLSVEIKNSTSDDIDPTTSVSSDAISIKELRSKFERQASSSAGVEVMLQQESSPALPIKQNSKLESTSHKMMGPTMIGSGIYIKNSPMQAMSSLESETLHTASGSIQSEANEGTVGDGTIGDGTLDTKMVLKYARQLEKRETKTATEQKAQKDREDCESIPSFENTIEKKDTSNSSKENNARDKTTDSNKNATTHRQDIGNDFSNFKLRQKAFEFKNNQAVAHGRDLAKCQQYTTNLERKERSGSKTSTNAAANDALLTPKRENNMRVASPATTVRDRIAVLGGQNTTPAKHLSRTPNKVLPRQHMSPNRAASQMQASPNKAMPLKQQLTQSARQAVAVNHITKSPPKIWVANQNGQGFSPVDNLYGNSSPHLNSRVRNRLPSGTLRIPPPLNMQSMSSEANQGKVRPVPIQAVCESPNASDYENAEEEDGITLSPTISEVSGLTLPTCLDGDADSTAFDSLSKTASLFHETVSPIARHRHGNQPDKHDLSSTLTASARISKHPYLQRMNTKPSHAFSGGLPRNTHVDSTDRIHEIPTPKAKGGMFSRREQIVRRVRASPRHKNFPQHSTHFGNVKPSSREWQERNVIAEHNISQSASGNNSSSFGRLENSGVPPVKPKGRVAERVTQVNEKTKNKKIDVRKKDCIRTIRID